MTKSIVAKKYDITLCVYSYAYKNNSRPNLMEILKNIVEIGDKEIFDKVIGFNIINKIILSKEDKEGILLSSCNNINDNTFFEYVYEKINTKGMEVKLFKKIFEKRKEPAILCFFNKFKIQKTDEINMLLSESQSRDWMLFVERCFLQKELQERNYHKNEKVEIKNKI